MDKSGIITKILSLCPILNCIGIFRFMPSERLPSLPNFPNLPSFFRFFLALGYDGRRKRWQASKPVLSRAGKNACFTGTL